MFLCFRRQERCILLTDICSQFSQALPEESVPKGIIFRADFVPLHGLHAISHLLVLSNNSLSKYASTYWTCCLRDETFNPRWPQNPTENCLKKCWTEIFCSFTVCNGFKHNLRGLLKSCVHIWTFHSCFKGNSQLVSKLILTLRMMDRRCFWAKELAISCE